MRFLSAELTTEGGSEGLSLFLFVERGVVLAVGRMTKAISASAAVIKRALLLLLRLLYLAAFAALFDGGLDFAPFSAS